MGTSDDRAEPDSGQPQGGPAPTDQVRTDPARTDQAPPGEARTGTRWTPGRRGTAALAAGVALGFIAFLLGDFGDDDWGRTPDTAVTSCPEGAVVRASNPGIAADQPMLPHRPGRIFACLHGNGSAGIDWQPGTVRTRVIKGKAADDTARLINAAPAGPSAGKCPPTDYEWLFFKNAAGHEAVVLISLCGGAFDGTRYVKIRVTPGEDYGADGADPAATLPR
ncbi:hypothetical protein [Yinghuangia soli]|uniref:Uncharacterized protein n=1 Tax=Yinghuangia soli TaxID=2908204 RepID=A0AA41PUU3_9ACTN|nr:hypothetical protein [Yinghuangia soli]MCF2526158.1 hypothetical protein [Yinghuangia soli]